MSLLNLPSQRFGGVVGRAGHAVGHHHHQQQKAILVVFYQKDFAIKVLEILNLLHCLVNPFSDLNVPKVRAKIDQSQCAYYLRDNIIILNFVL